jgi:hypothetical protein
LNGNSIAAAAPEHRQAMKSLLALPFESSEALVDAVGPRGFRIRAARSWGARSSASLLINRLYSGRGYKSNPLPDAGSPNRLTLVASDHDFVVGTLTIGFDSDERLLVDDLFPGEVDALRSAGRDVCEFTKLAMDSVVRSQRVLAAMFHVAFIHAHLIKGCDNLLIEVNPRHTRYYEAKLGFRALGPERLNRRVNAPAVLLSLDLWYAQSQIRKFGGMPELASEERSLYPFAFSVVEEAGIVGRLRGYQSGAEAADPVMG